MGFSRYLLQHHLCWSVLWSLSTSPLVPHHLAQGSLYMTHSHRAQPICHSCPSAFPASRHCSILAVILMKYQFGSCAQTLLLLGPHATQICIQVFEMDPNVWFAQLVPNSPSLCYQCSSIYSELLLGIGTWELTLPDSKQKGLCSQHLHLQKPASALGEVKLDYLHFHCMSCWNYQEVHTTAAQCKDAPKAAQGLQQTIFNCTKIDMEISTYLYFTLQNMGPVTAVV